MTLILLDTYFDSSMNVCDILDAKHLILKSINQTTLDIYLIHLSKILNVMCTHSLFLPWFPRKRSHRSWHRKREREEKKKRGEETETLFSDWVFTRRSESVEGEERKNVCSLFSLALEATENSSLHFSCQAVALLMVCSQSVVRQKGGFSRHQACRESG